VVVDIINWPVSLCLHGGSPPQVRDDRPQPYR
jgi:hypothetical protein